MAVELHTTLTTRLVEELRVAIRTGQISPGTRLRQADVAARYKISTTPVREAFAILEREGMLISSPRRGVIVFQPTVEDLRETYAVRIALETLATELSVQNMTSEGIAELDELLRQMDLAQDDRDRYLKLNTEFHRAIYQAAKQPKLERFIAQLLGASAAYLYLYTTFAVSPADMQRDHHLIVEAFRDGDAKRAGEAMATHLQHTVDLISVNLADLDALRESDPSTSVS